MASNIGKLLSKHVDELRIFKLPKFFETMTYEVDRTMDRSQDFVSDRQHAYNVWRCGVAVIKAIEDNATIDANDGMYLLADRAFMGLMSLFKDIGHFDDAALRVARIRCKGAKAVANYIMKALRDWATNVLEIDLNKAAVSASKPPSRVMSPTAAEFVPASARAAPVPAAPVPLPVPIQIEKLPVIPASVRIQAAFYGALAAIKKEAPHRLIVSPDPLISNAEGMKTIALKKDNGMYSVLMMAEVHSLEGIL